MEIVQRVHLVQSLLSEGHHINFYYSHNTYHRIYLLNCNCIIFRVYTIKSKFTS